MDIHPEYGDLDEQWPGGWASYNGKHMFATKREAVADFERAKAEEAAATHRPECFVYFIRRGERGPIKIGSAKDPASRLKALQTGSDIPLRIVAVMPGTRADEIALHRRFAESRVQGEWFAGNAALSALMQKARRDNKRWMP